MINCKYCQAILPDHTRYCGQCGRVLETAAQIPALGNEQGGIYPSPPVIAQMPERTPPLAQEYAPVPLEMPAPANYYEVSVRPTSPFPLAQESPGLKNLSDAPTMQLPDTDSGQRKDDRRRRSDDPVFFPLRLFDQIPAEADQHGLHHQPEVEHSAHHQPQIEHGSHHQSQIEHGSHHQPEAEHGAHHQSQIGHSTHHQPQIEHGAHHQSIGHHTHHQSVGQQNLQGSTQNYNELFKRGGETFSRKILKIPNDPINQPKKTHKAQKKGPLSGLIIIASVIIITLIGLLTSLFHALGYGLNGAPTVNMPSTASPGEIIVLRGRNFTPAAEIAISLDQPNNTPVNATPPGSMPTSQTTFPSQKTMLTVLSNGTFTTKIQIDPSWKIGSKHTIYILKQDGSAILSQPFTIVASKPALILCGTNSSHAAITLGPVVTGETLQSAVPFTLCTQGTGQISWKSSWNTNQAPWLVMTQNGTVAAPGKFSIQINATTKSLKVGNYQANVTFSSSQTGQTITLQITLVIQNQNTQVCIHSSSKKVSMTGVQGSANPIQQTLTINNCGSTYTWTPIITTSDGSDWLSINPTRGTLKKGASQNITLEASGANLATGTYTGSITIGSGKNAANIVVTLVISAQQQPCISVNPGQLTFTGRAGGNNPASQRITLTNSCSAGIWSETTDQSWLSLDTSNGTLPANGSTTATVSVSMNNLSEGTYTGHITIAPGSATVMVTLQIQSAVTVVPSAIPLEPCISLGKSNAAFSVMQGSASSGVAQPISFTDKAGCGSGTWSAQSDAPWITLKKSSGTITAGNSDSTTATINETAAGVGTFTGHITVTAGSSTTVFTVYLTVYAQLSISASTPATVSINTYYETTTGVTRFVVTNQANPGTLTISSITTDDGANWLSASIPANSVLASGGSLVVPVTVNDTGLQLGNYTGHITVTITGSDGGSTSIQVTVNMNVYNSAPVIT